METNRARLANTVAIKCKVNHRRINIELGLSESYFAAQRVPHHHLARATIKNAIQPCVAYNIGVKWRPNRGNNRRRTQNFVLITAIEPGYSSCIYGRNTYLQRILASTNPR